MRKWMRLRFWVEMGLAVTTGVLFVITLLWKDWIEILFHVDPDRGSGTLEWLVVGGFLAVTVVLALVARSEWRRAPIASA